MKKCKVLVLMAAYNGSLYLKEQLDSILNQVHVEVDILISLDLSSDNSLYLVQDYCKKYTNISLLPYGIRYGSAGQNFFRLILESDFLGYDYISFADQDDIWLDNKLYKAISVLRNNQCDAYSSNVTAFWSNGKKKLIKKSFPQKEFDYLFESSGPGCTFVLSNVLAMDIKSFLLNCECKHKLWLHDWFCYSLARHKGYKWFIDGEPLMLYRQHDSNEVGANTGLGAIIHRARLVLCGTAFERVLLQAEILNQSELPILLLRNGGRMNLLKLACMAPKCRREVKDVLMFFCAVFLYALKRR